MYKIKYILQDHWKLPTSGIHHEKQEKTYLCKKAVYPLDYNQIAIVKTNPKCL